MVMRYLAIVLVLLAGCATGLTASDKLRLACEGYASSLIVLADLRMAGRLTPANIAAVDKARSVATPLCTGSGAATPEVSLAAVEAALIELRKVQVQHGR